MGPVRILCVQLVDWTQVTDGGDIVLASDGLWEFVANQEVAATVARVLAAGDSLGVACTKLVEEAQWRRRWRWRRRRRWRWRRSISENTQIDDTICILISFDCVTGNDTVGWTVLKIVDEKLGFI